MDQLTDLDNVSIARIGPAITEIRFHSGMKLTNAIIARVMRSPGRYGNGPKKVIVVFPEHIDFNVQVLLQDHHAANGMAGAQALAIVCNEFGLIPMLHLYFAYYPPNFVVKFCNNVEDARHWLTAWTGQRLAV